MKEDDEERGRGEVREKYSESWGSPIIEREGGSEMKAAALQDMMSAAA